MSALAAMLVAFATIATGLAGQLDRRLSDRWFSASRIEPSGNVVLVDVSTAARTGGDTLHLSRTRLADLLSRLAAAGAEKILIDLNLSGATTPAADNALEAALAGLSPEKVAVTSTAVVATDAEGTPHWRRTVVYEPFAHNATLVASDLAFDADDQLRQFGVSSPDLPSMPSSAGWLDGLSLESQPRRIDYRINVTHIPVLDAANLLNADSSRGQLTGRAVVLANFAAAIGNDIRVPRFGSLRRSEITALSAETLLQPRPLRALPRLAAVLTAMILAASIALWSARLAPLPGAGAVVGVTLCIFGGGALLQNRFGVMVPAGSALLATLLGYGAVQVAKVSGLRRAGGNAAGQDFASAISETDAAFVFDPSGTVLSMNAAARSLFAHSSDSHVLSVEDLIGPQADALLSLTSVSHPGRLVAVLDGDKRRHLDFTVSTMHQEGTWVGLASIRDITLEQAQLDELRLLVVQDALTGLTNRLGFDRALAAGCEAMSGSNGNEMAILLCDLDGFKGVNDTQGHQAGDAVLIETARRLQAAVELGAVMARLGGDEFGLILHARRLDHEDMDRLVENIIERVSAPIAIGLETVSVGISIGTALCPSQDCTPNGLIRIADANMYGNKRRRAVTSIRRERAA